MAGALDQPAGAVEKLVGHPFQGDPAVRAAVEVDKALLSLAYRKHLLAGYYKPLAAGIGELVDPAQGDGAGAGWQRVNGHAASFRQECLWLAGRIISASECWIKTAGSARGFAPVRLATPRVPPAASAGPRCFSASRWRLRRVDRPARPGRSLQGAAATDRVCRRQRHAGSAPQSGRPSVVVVDPWRWRCAARFPAWYPTAAAAGACVHAD